MTTQTEVMNLALEALKKLGDYPHAFDECTNAIKALEEALNHCEDKLNMVKQEQGEPVAWADHGVVNWIADKQFQHAALLYEHPQQRTWVGLMRGVRVEGDNVIISVHYGNDAARQVCGELIKEMNT